MCAPGPTALGLVSTSSDKSVVFRRVGPGPASAAAGDAASGLVASKYAGHQQSYGTLYCVTTTADGLQAVTAGGDKQIR